MQILIDAQVILNLKKVVVSLSDDKKRTLLSKLVCEESQKMQYWIKYENDADSNSNIFLISVVPHQLVYRPEKWIF